MNTTNERGKTMNTYQANPFVVTIHPDAFGAADHIASLFVNYTVELRFRGDRIALGYVARVDDEVIVIDPDDGTAPTAYGLYDGSFDEIRYL